MLVRIVDDEAIAKAFADYYADPSEPGAGREDALAWARDALKKPLHEFMRTGRYRDFPFGTNCCAFIIGARIGRGEVPPEEVPK